MVAKLQWSDAEIEVLTNLWGKTRDKESLLPLLDGKTVVMASRKFKELGLTNEYNISWTKEEDDLLRKYWPDAMNNDEILHHFVMRSYEAITGRVVKLKLKKTDRVLDIRAEQLRVSRSSVWSKEDTELLIIHWPNCNKESDILHLFPNRDEDAIQRRAYYLKLKKNDNIQAQITQARVDLIVERNKTVGRPMSYEFAKQEALKYRSRFEFRKTDLSLYTYARINGLLDEICAHMIVGDYFNYPQTFLYFCVRELFPDLVIRYNDRIAIKPKEIDVYVVDKKIGFEYDGIRFHADDDDTKDILCNQSGITLYKIPEVYKHSPEIPIITALTNFGFDTSKFDIDVLVQLTLDKKYSIGGIEAIVAKYKTMKEFRRGDDKSLYTFLQRKGLLASYTTTLIQDRKAATEEEVIMALRECKSKTEFFSTDKYRRYYLIMMKKDYKNAKEIYRMI